MITDIISSAASSEEEFTTNFIKELPLCSMMFSVGQMLLRKSTKWERGREGDMRAHVVQKFSHVGEACGRTFHENIEISYELSNRLSFWSGLVPQQSALK